MPARSTPIASELGWLDGIVQHCQANQDGFAEWSHNVGERCGMDSCCQSCLGQHSKANHIGFVDGNLKTKPTKELVLDDVPFSNHRNC